jgi:hypothetical protein
MSTVFDQSRQNPSQDFIEGILDFLLKTSEDLLKDNVFSGSVLKLCTMVNDPSFKSLEVHQLLIFSGSTSKKDIERRLHPAHTNSTCYKEWFLQCIDNLAPAAELTNVFDEKPLLVNGNEPLIQVSNKMDRLPYHIQRKEAIAPTIIPLGASLEGNGAITL